MSFLSFLAKEWIFRNFRTSKYRVTANEECAYHFPSGVFNKYYYDNSSDTGNGKYDGDSDDDNEKWW